MPPKTKQAAPSKGRTKRNKQPTQKPPQQRILVLKDGRRRVFEWRDW